jgi:hypothetical protein
VSDHCAHQAEARNTNAGHAIAPRPNPARLEVAWAIVAEGADEVDDRRTSQPGSHCPQRARGSLSPAAQLVRLPYQHGSPGEDHEHVQHSHDDQCPFKVAAPPPR